MVEVVGGGGGDSGVMQWAEAAASSVLCVISEKTPNIVTVRLGQASQAGRVFPCPCLLSV